MRKLIVLIFLTLDGVMQSDDGPEVDRSFGFTYGGWSTPYFDDFLEQTLAVVLATWDIRSGKAAVK